MQLRALMDARNSSDAWDLRCLVREKLIDFLQKNYPKHLPRIRGEFDVLAAERTLEQPQNDSRVLGLESGEHRRRTSV